MGSNINTIFAQRMLVRKCTDLIKASGVCPETKPSEWKGIVEEAHKRGYLYASFEKDELSCVACGYRVSSIDKDIGDVAPEFEKGPIFYVTWAASKANSQTKLLRMLKTFLKMNKDIHTVVFHNRGNNEDLRVYRRPGGKHV